MENTVVVKVEKIMRDQAFVEQLMTADTAEAAQALFASKDIAFTLEEVKQIGAGLRAVCSDELNAEDLDAVAGGSVLGTVAAVVSIIAGVVKVVDFIGKRVGWWS